MLTQFLANNLDKFQKIGIEGRPKVIFNSINPNISTEKNCEFRLTVAVKKAPITYIYQIQTQN